MYNAHTHIQVMNKYAATLEINQALMFATSEGASLSCDKLMLWGSLRSARRRR